jgi:hypothetical protein
MVGPLVDGLERFECVRRTEPERRFRFKVQRIAEPNVGFRFRVKCPEPEPNRTFPALV